MKSAKDKSIFKCLGLINGVKEPLFREILKLPIPVPLLKTAKKLPREFFNSNIW